MCQVTKILARHYSRPIFDMLFLLASAKSATLSCQVQLGCFVLVRADPS